VVRRRFPAEEAAPLSGIMYRVCRSSTHQACRQTVRSFSAGAKAVATTAPKFNVVKFVPEDPQKVSEEVPAFSFYDMPDQLDTNPYVSAPLSEKIVEIQPAVLTKPEYQFSKLENGLKIVSVDKGGQAASLGLFVNVGSRFETPESQGLTSMVEMMSYRSTAHLGHLRTVKTFEQLAVKASARAGREQIMYTADCLRDIFPLVAPLMIGNVLYPRLVRWEVASAESKVREFEIELKNDVDEYVADLLHQAGFHNNTLGNPSIALQSSMKHMDEHSIRKFMVDHFAPERMTFVGVNVGHDDLCKWLMRSFVDYNAIPMKAREEPKPVYTGGYRYIHADERMCNVGVAFQAPGGWGSDDSYALSILQTILGGNVGDTNGNMHTKLSQLVAKNPSVSSCMAFNNQYSDGGLFGIYAAVSPEAVPAYLHQAQNVLSSPVSTDDVKKAKAVLKGQCLSMSQSELVEDIGRQMIMTGVALSPEEVCAKIDAVSDSQIKSAQSLVTKCKPTIVGLGDIAYMPHYDFVCQLFSSASPVVFKDPAQKK
jgi:processing peptidase subunit alpha